MEEKSNNNTALVPFKNGEKTENTPSRDPETGRFVEGGEGGPGRPKGLRNMNTLITEELQELSAKDTKGNILTVERALIKKIVRMALEGDRRMIELIWNYRDGKPPQNIDISYRGNRVGTVLVTPEEEQRIEELFAPRHLLPLPTQHHGDNKLPTPKSDGSHNQRGDAIPQEQQSRSAYEGNA